MEDLHAAIKDLQTTLQSLLKKYNNVKKENETLKKQSDAIKNQLLEKNNLINSTEEKIAIANINSIYSVEEKQLLQTKIDYYLKDIEKCLALLNA